MSLLTDNFIWSNTLLILDTVKMCVEWAMGVYLQGVGEVYKVVPEPHNQDLYDLKEVVFAGLRFLPIPCVAIPGFPLGPIVYYLT